MTKTPSLFVVFLLFLSASVLAVKIGSRPYGSTAPRTIQAARAQAAPMTETRLAAVDGAPSASATVVGPLRIELTDDQNLLLIDDGRLGWMAEYTPSGERRREFEGEGVPKFESITDVAASPGQLWIADLLGHNLHVLDRRTNQWSTRQLDTKPYRVAVVGVEHDRLFTMHIGVTRTFVVRRDSGEIITAAPPLLIDQAKTALALDGFIAATPGSTLFAGKHLGILASFDDAGSLKWLVEPIAPPAAPLVLSEGNRRWLQHGPLPASQSLAVNAEIAVVLARRVSGFKLSSFLDVYRVADGAYVRSLLLPGTGSWTAVAMSGQRLYAANRTALYQWPITVTSGDAAPGERLITFRPAATRPTS